MLSGGESLEDYAAERARSQLTGLLEGAPTIAHVLDENDVPRDADIDEVEVGGTHTGSPRRSDSSRRCPGVEVAYTEESSLTGEPLPVEHKKGEKFCPVV